MPLVGVRASTVSRRGQQCQAVGEAVPAFARAAQAHAPLRNRSILRLYRGAAMPIWSSLQGKTRHGSPRRNPARRITARRTLLLEALEDRCLLSGNLWTQRGGDAGHTSYVDVT